jgi:hypothetical protein
MSTAASQTCGTCACAAPWKELGFVRCRYLPAWQYVAERLPCRFTPSRWQERLAP